MKIEFLGENMHFDLQNTCQSHIFDENLKWSHGRYGHFALAGLTGNPDNSSFFYESVESDFFKSLGLSFEVISDDLNRFLRQIRWQLDPKLIIRVPGSLPGMGDVRKTTLWKGLGVPPVPVVLTQYRKKKRYSQEGWWVQWRVAGLIKLVSWKL